MKSKNGKLFLKYLNLKNVATFPNQTIEFSSGYNAIIGETGSGKSLILEALQIIFGNRVDKKLIRKDSEFFTVEAIFSCADDDIHSYFNKIGFPFENNEIIIKRIIYKSGSSKSYLNYQSCNLSALINFSRKFIDLVGQFENQKLLSELYQLKLLDDFSNLSVKLDEYQEKFQEITQQEKKINSLKINKDIRAQKIDFLEFQIGEIKKLNPDEKDEERIIQEKLLYQNQEKLLKSSDKILSLLSCESNGNNVIQFLSNAIKESRNISELIDPKVNELLEGSLELINECSFKLSKSNVSIDSEEQIDFIISRLDSYQKLKRKFGGTTASILEHLGKFETEYADLINIDENISLLEVEIKELQTLAWKLALDLHQTRKESAKKLSLLLTKNVQSLKMVGATIKFDITQSESLNEFGISKISLMAQTNKGEGFYKIKNIASGGELSRILLSLRQILACNESISIFLFDEIDAGIGGETALSIGSSLKNVSNNSQVIAITHLPQIANYSDKLILVDKELRTFENGERTVSFVREITGKKMRNEILSMTPLSS